MAQTAAREVVDVMNCGAASNERIDQVRTDERSPARS
jgi:hypothetical protein